MKTPREILLNRHRAAQPKLDAIRKHVLAEHAPARGASPPVNLTSLARQFWAEVIWPARRVWLGFAAAWLVIAALNLASRETRLPTASNASAPAPEALLALREQRKLLSQLLEPGAAPSAAPAAGRLPRSQNLSNFVLG
jgi:hypothetical protein